MDTRTEARYDSEIARNDTTENERSRATIEPRAAAKIQPELMSGETLQWAAMPNPGVVFHSDDWSVVPFSILWGGFAIFWESGVLGYWGNGTKNHSAPWFFELWGIPFVIAGQYFIWGRFLTDAWLKRRTYYAATDRRVLILQEGWKRKTRSCYLESIPEIAREGQNRGTLWLGQKLPIWGRRREAKQSMSRFDVDSSVPVLADIDDLDVVYRMIMDLREQARKENTVGGEEP